MNAHCFLDGGYLRGLAKAWKTGWVNPRVLANNIAYSSMVQHWGMPKGSADPKSFPSVQNARISLARVIYYDARPDEGPESAIEDYWRTIELLNDTELGFGALKGQRKRRRQKGVDGLIAVQMLEGAFNNLFQVALLVAGDGDFVPIVEAVRRRGVMVVVAAEKSSLSDELRRVADRIWLMDRSRGTDFPELRDNDGRRWIERTDGTFGLEQPVNP